MLSPLTLRLVFCVCVLGPTFCQGQVPDVKVRSGVTQFQQIEQVIAAWQPDRHVFVKGDIGVGQQQLEQLQTWIEQNAPHWTVVLMDTADNERYRAADGREYRELDAVEHALGNGLSNRTGFGSLEHPQTGESDGAIFALFLKERKFSYFASDAQDRRGLGEAKWQGRLDQPAFRAMRNGGRILDAAKDTIRTINSQLTAAIASEAASAERAARERERAAAEVRRGAQLTRERIEEVQLAAANFRLQQPLATGPLAAPPLATWQTEMEAITAEISPDTARGLEQRLAKLNDAVERHLNGYASIQGLAAHEQELERQLNQLSQSPGQAAAAEIAQARQLFGEVQQRAVLGELGIEEALGGVNALVQAGQTRVAEEAADRQRAALQALWIRRTVLFMLLLTALAVLGILAILNLRRRSAMLRAQRELALREASVVKETDGINTLFVRNEEILGSRDKLMKRGYEGLTQQTSQRALDYVDDLFIMSKEIRRVVSEAKELVYPSRLTGRIVNLVSSTRYQQAINQVSGKPLQFNRVNGLPSVLRDQIQLNQDGSLPEEISMTFEDVFRLFQQRGEDARHALDTIESSLTEVGDALKALQRDLELVMAQEKELTHAATQDHYFNLPNFFDKLIPAVQQDLETAEQQSAFDAVQAMQGAIPAARRKLSEATALATGLMDARGELFPELTATAQELQKFGYTSTWIDEDLADVTDRANRLLEIATQQSIATDIEQVTARLNQILAKSETAVAHARAIDSEFAPALHTLSEKVEQGRKSLANTLGVAIEVVLNEPNRDPDDWIATARKHLETARATLALGRNEAVGSALAAMQAAAERADQILEASTAAAAAYDKLQQQARDELQRLLSRLPGVKQAVEPLQATYEASALLMQDIGPDESQTQDSKLSAAQVVEQASAPIAQIEAWLNEAVEAHHRGLVLTAEDLQHEAALALMYAHQRLDRVQRHLQSIVNQTTENQTTLQRLIDQCTVLVQSSRDPLVMQPTVSATEQTRQSLEGWRRDLATSHVARNPFEVQQHLEGLKQTLLQLDAQCAADRQAHAEAARAVSGADRQLQLVTQLVRQSQTDGIPDSQNIIDANNRVAVLARSLKNVQHELAATHGNWKMVDDHASRIQIELREAADLLGGELRNASQALSNFQLASQAVYQAEQWSGTYGVRVAGSPGVSELERARQGLQQGNYNLVLELARIATTTAQSAVQQAEREVTRRRIAEQQAAEAERRRRAARSRNNSPFGGGFTIGSSGGSFGGGGMFGGGSSSSRSSSSRSSSSRSSSSGSGFGRSGW